MVSKEIEIDFKDFIRQELEKIFGSKGWSPIIAGILIGLVNIVSYVWVKKPFTVYTGFLNWGQHIYSLIGLNSIAGVPKLIPLLEPTSVGDIGAIIGAMIAASLANEFAIRRISNRVEVFEAIAGGVLMALGVSLAFGCNWGGFLSAITSWSLHGFAFLVGALIGGYLGLKYVTWKAEKIMKELEIVSSSSEEFTQILSVSKARKSLGKYVALAVAIVMLTLLTAYYASIGSPMVGGLFIGITIGILIQRARFCFATAFRDLFNGPENARALDIHKGIAIAILVGSTGVFALKFMSMVKEDIGVAPVHIINTVGGLLFTFGSVLAGGCASGILWRTGEGHIKAWIALLTTVLAYPIFSQLIRPYVAGNPRIFIPYSIGWIQAFIFMIIFITFYILSIYYLEYKYRSR
jgi:uncharacterized membrane protein YedE/YeeE